MYYMCLDLHGCKLQVDWHTTAWQQLCFTPHILLIQFTPSSPVPLSKVLMGC